MITLKPFMNRLSRACWTKRPTPIRLPRECGDPVKRRLHEVVNNIISIRIDPFGELFIYWIPAFARKTLEVKPQYILVTVL
jgi:hypothetical protein